MEHGVNADTRGYTTGIHGSMTAVAATARQHHGANTDIPAVLLPQTTADSPTVYIAFKSYHRHTGQFFLGGGEPFLPEKYFNSALKSKNCYANLQNYFSQLTAPNNY